MSWRQSVTAGDILLFLTWHDIAIQRVIAAGTNLTKEALIRKLCEKRQTECRYGRLLSKPGASSTKATLFSPQVCFENAALEKVHRRRCRCEILLYYPMSTSYCVPECQQKGGKSSAGEKVWFFEFPLRTWRENRKKNPKKPINGWFSHDHYVTRLWYSNFLFHDQAQNLPLRTPIWLTLSTSTLVSKFSSLFSLHFLRYWQGECVWQLGAS